MSDSDATERVAYLLWQVSNGYLKAEDRAIGVNWFLRPEGQLHPDDRAERSHWMALAAEVMDLVRDEERPA